MKQTQLKTPVGTAFIKGNHRGIAKISIHKSSPFTDTPEEPPRELKPCIAQLKAYFYKDLHYFDLKLNPLGTAFQKEVWQTLRKIPYGQTLSYQQLARKIGNPKAVRAVAAANGKNPLWVVTPCHRIIGSDGSLTGYAGGLWRKKWLLTHENALRQQALF